MAFVEMGRWAGPSESQSRAWGGKGGRNMQGHGDMRWRRHGLITSGLLLDICIVCICIYIYTVNVVFVCQPTIRHNRVGSG